MKPVLVTTEHRGVFFGYYDGDESAKVATIANARNCVYWGASVKGFLGLAANGPDSSCRIGPAVPNLTLQAVTSIAECSEKAAAAWEAAKWGK